jgi:hypothetical protein
VSLHPLLWLLWAAMMCVAGFAFEAKALVGP